MQVEISRKFPPSRSLQWFLQGSSLVYFSSPLLNFVLGYNISLCIQRAVSSHVLVGEWTTIWLIPKAVLCHVWSDSFHLWEMRRETFIALTVLTVQS